MEKTVPAIDQTASDELTELATSCLNSGRALLAEATSHPGKDRNRFLTAVADVWFQAADQLANYKAPALADVRNAIECLNHPVLLSVQHQDSARQKLTDATTYLYAAGVAGRVARRLAS
uniref:Uncharacterized protein n=1 Tax=Streptomyces sp. 44030 TaxID=364102 RepID=Q2LEX3_9ACTN|nr:hypothetical protein [Streptomyces sp. 44030]ABC67342.1 hypothetical protein pRL1.13 [Streptomyces sp. 44030]